LSPRDKMVKAALYPIHAFLAVNAAISILADGPTYKAGQQDPLVDKLKYAPACPDYKYYAMHGQYVLALITNSITVQPADDK
jgi:hypothetical protein